MTVTSDARDPWDHRLALGATQGTRVARLNRAGVLVAADVHVATRLSTLAGETDEHVTLALALAVRAVRLGSVCVDLAAPPALAEVGHPGSAELAGWTWPQPEEWRAAVSVSALARAGVLRVEHGLVYLDRYHQQESAVAAALLERLSAPAVNVPEDRLAAGLERLFGGEAWAEQRDAAEAACRGLTTVVTGGPGTGKTTTLARVLALLSDLAGGPLRIGLAAPTGKASARMAQAVLDAVGDPTFPPEDRERLGDLSSSTLHRLLGSLPDNGTRFRHDRRNPLPHDVVVVDEMSMVPLTLMTRLLEALRPGTRLLLVGDPDQLAPVEAGMVLRDVVEGLEPHPSRPVRRLLRTHRFGAEISALATAIRDGDGDRAWRLLGSGGEAVALLGPGDVEACAQVVVDAAQAAVLAAESGDRAAALRALGAHRLLCAHREGPFGVSTWNRLTERRLGDRLGRQWLGRWYAGQPLLMTVNDPTIGLANGDTGIVMPDQPQGSRLLSVFEQGGDAEGVAHPLTRLGSVVTAHAMTVHRAQGSQFGEVTVLLPGPESRILTRELLYTAITRARERVRVVTDEATFRAAVARRTERATGLARRLDV